MTQMEVGGWGRDLGTAPMWVVAAVALVAWLAALAACVLRVRPGRVPPCEAVRGLAGDECPAVVNLVTGGWWLAWESVPATLIDLAARGYVTIGQLGGQTVVHAPPHGVGASTGSRAAVPPLVAHERMVLDHVQQLAGRSPQWSVPAAALTTGAGQEARRWWRRFRATVHREAMDRGLARRRWTVGRRIVLIVAAAVPSLAVGFAAGLAVDQDDITGAGVGASIFYGAIVFMALAAVVLTRSGVTDTSGGREVAARWLCWRATLASDPGLAVSQPSDVGVRGRALAYATAMGFAPGVAQGLPLRASSSRRTWSPAGGTWRLVRIHYPRLWGGLHPAAVLLAGLALTVPPLAVATGMAQSGVWDGEGAGITLLMMSPLVTMAACGLWPCALAVLDLGSARRTVEGEVLQIRRKRSSKTESWYVAVDDGTSHRIRAWWVPLEPDFGVGAVVRADVSRYLGHARRVEVVRPGMEVAKGVARNRTGSSACLPMRGRRKERG